MIPDEAVEAAARVMHAHDTDHAGEFALWIYQEEARAILEAAAPHLMASAWGEGYRECYERQMYEPVPVNPHRPTNV